MRDRSNLPIGLAPRRRRFGLLTQLIVLLVCGGAFFLLVTAVFSPWGFYLGGHFHPLPYWQGWGKTNVASAGGEYLLFARVQPSARGSKMYLTTNLSGIA